MGSIPVLTIDDEPDACTDGRLASTGGASRRTPSVRPIPAFWSGRLPCRDRCSCCCVRIGAECLDHHEGIARRVDRPDCLVQTRIGDAPGCRIRTDRTARKNPLLLHGRHVDLHELHGTVCGGLAPVVGVSRGHTDAPVRSVGNPRNRHAARRNVPGHLQGSSAVLLPGRYGPGHGQGTGSRRHLVRAEHLGASVRWEFDHDDRCGRHPGWIRVLGSGTRATRWEHSGPHAQLTVSRCGRTRGRRRILCT
jgi:hypothetical protein